MKIVNLKSLFMFLVLLICLVRAEASSDQPDCVHVDGDERFCFVVKNESPDLLTDLKISVDSMYVLDGRFTRFHDYVSGYIGDVKENGGETPKSLTKTIRPMETNCDQYNPSTNLWTITYKRNGQNYSAVFEGNVCSNYLDGDSASIVYINADNSIAIEAPKKRFVTIFSYASPSNPTCVVKDTGYNGTQGRNRFCFVASNRTHDQLTNVRIDANTDYLDGGYTYHDYVLADIGSLDDKPTDPLMARPLLAFDYGANNTWTIRYKRNGTCYGVTLNNQIFPTYMINDQPSNVIINTDNSVGILVPNQKDPVDARTATEQPCSP
ncbi:MAG TPA: hypothetical protein VKR58_08140 [Aquella sp.]|nr:hypothetical protein [Aquella sp.]